MASLFAANPFTSPVGQRIERATDGGLASEDWALNLEICDIINETDEGPKDAAKAIRKRLANNKNFKSVILTLTVLESCVKNCGHRFHVLIAKKDFLDELVKILNPKANAPQVVQDKILSLIQDWADAFRNSPDMIHVLQTYESLRQQGIEFPAKNLDTLSPIFTPERSQPEPPPGTRPTESPSHQNAPYSRQEVPPPDPVPQAPVTITGPVNPNPEQLAKLRSELDIVQGNVQVMSEMLTEMTPGQEEAGDLELMQELNRTCRAMQQRLMLLLEQVANEEVVGELLRINDDLNNVFIRYDRYERFRQVQSKPAEPPRPATTGAPAMPPMPSPQQASAGAAAPPSQAALDSLISFDDVPTTQTSPPQAIGGDSSMTSQLQQLDIKRGTQEPDMAASVAHDDDFDMFAQSRKSTFEESRKAGSSYSDNLQPFDKAIADSMSVDKPKPNPAQSSEPSAMNSIEAWLGEEENEGKVEGDSETMSSQDFDQFLAQRASAEGQRTNSVKAGSQRPKQRQMQMENKDDDMFGL